MTYFGAQSLQPFGISARVFRCLRLIPSLPPATQDSLRGEADFPFHDGTFTRKISATFLGAQYIMSDLTIHASPEFLNRLDWQLRRLLLLIEVVEGNAVSLGELHEALHTLLEEAQSKK